MIRAHSAILRTAMNLVYVDIRGPEWFKREVLAGLRKRQISAQALAIPNALKIEYLDPINTYSAFDDEKFVYVVRVDATVPKKERDRLKELVNEENSQVFAVESAEEAIGDSILDRIAEIVIEHM